MKEIFETVFEECTFGSIEDGYLIHYSQPCVIMEGSWVESEITIYEFIHTCKVWAAERSYSLESSVHMKPKSSSVAGCQVHWRYESEDLPYFEADSEPEAVLEAFKWVLNNQEGK